VTEFGPLAGREPEESFAAIGDHYGRIASIIRTEFGCELLN